MIDWARVNILKEEVGTDDFDEIVELFLEEVTEVIERLAQAPEQSTLEEDLHFLKGSALGLGFRQFSRLCQTAETLSAKGRTSEVDLPEILSCFAKSQVYFRENLPNELHG